MPRPSAPAGTSASTPGYLVTTGDGAVASFGNLAYKGSLLARPDGPVVGMAMTPDEKGYWLLSSRGTVYPFGDATDYPPVASQDLADQTFVGMAATPDGKGYWLVTSGGGIFTYGDANYYGGQGATVMPAGIVGMAATWDGRGYWLVSSKGHVYTFGDAISYGSVNPVPAAPVMGMSVTATGGGYLIMTSSGHVYAFGDATYLGSGPTAKGYGPYVAIAAAPSASGYWLLDRAGRVLNFGAPWRGSGLGNMPAGTTASAMAAAPATGNDVVSKGAFGNTSPAAQPSPPTTTTTSTTTTSTTTSTTSTTTTTLPVEPKAKSTKPKATKPRSVTAAKPKPKATEPKAPPRQKSHPSSGRKAKSAGKPKKTTAPRTVPAGKVASHKVPSHKVPSHKVRLVTGPLQYPAGARGYDVSWPQCRTRLPPHARVAVVGVNGGWAFTGNPCFQKEASWAAGNLSVYINLNSPRGADSSEWQSGPAGHCGRDLSCQAYNYGYNTAMYSIGSARAEGARSKTWWLDVETASPWSASQRDNARVIAGALAALRSRKLNVAIYSTDYQWDIITGGYLPGTNVWYPTGIATKRPQAWCSGTSFAGGPVSLVQSAAGHFDGDYSC